MDIKTKDYTWAVFTPHEPRPSNFLLWYSQKNKGWPRCAFRVKLVPNDMAVCFNLQIHSAKTILTKIFISFFWLKLNNDTVLEASILEYDRYEPPLGARSCHRYLEFWQDLKISIYYVNHVLLVILRLMGTFKNVLEYSSFRSPVEVGPCTLPRTWTAIW